MSQFLKSWSLCRYRHRYRYKYRSIHTDVDTDVAASSCFCFFGKVKIRIQNLGSQLQSFSWHPCEKMEDRQSANKNILTGWNTTKRVPTNEMKLCQRRRQSLQHASGIHTCFCPIQHSVSDLWCRIMQTQSGEEMKPGRTSNMTDDRIKILTGWVTVLKLISRIMVKPYSSV
jgi:hypothetical protein